MSVWFTVFVSSAPSGQINPQLLQVLVYLTSTFFPDRLLRSSPPAILYFKHFENFTLKEH